ncbi:MAG TPA: hypothetical protein VK152_09605 [Paludibacter sp.]|nr:hypothetical protein [Paludibacter sp.]
MKRKPATLLFCLAMDALGLASLLVPFLGEWTDIVWAPISAFIFYKSFGGKTGKLGSLLDFTEEILPFADFIPTFTLAYIYERYFKKK